MSNHKISFIIPALNESGNLPQTINSIKSEITNTPYEIIVVDNGSTDNTIDIAKNLGALTLENPEKTIGGLRNLGIKFSSGSLICFIDSDVSIAKGWENELHVFLHNLDGVSRFITGSRCEIELENQSFIEKNWFNLLKQGKSEYINSGHMITSRETFDIINGFDETLKTGEDYDFCQRGKKSNIPIINNQGLKAYHRGYPKTLKDFLLREAWHGRSDTTTFQAFISSKVAIMSLANAVALLALILGLLSTQAELVVIGAVGTIAIPSLSTAYRFKNLSIMQFLKTAFCFEIYMTGRFFSFFYNRNRPAARE